MTRSRRASVFILVTFLMLLGVLVARLGPRTIARELVSAGPGVVWLIAVYGAGSAIGALPWWLLLPRAVRPTRTEAIASRLAASGANAVLPMLGFGGEPVRLLWLRADARAAGVAALIVDRLLFVAGSAVFLLAGVIAVVATMRFPRAYVIAGVIGVTLLVLGTLAVGWLAARHRLVGRLHRGLRRLQRKAAAPAAGFGADVDAGVEAIVARGGGPLVASGLLHLLGRLVLGAEVYVGFLLLDVSLSPVEALIFASVPILLAFAGAIVPSQIGLQEGAQTLVAAALGLPPHAALTVVLLQRGRQLVSVGVAWILIAVVRARPRA